MADKKMCDYVFLSPIFDSISKEGYASAFTSESIREAAEKGIIDKRVIALGGVDENNLLQVKDFGFGGAAILGGLWNKFDPASDYNYQELIAHFRKIVSDWPTESFAKILPETFVRLKEMAYFCRK